MSQGQRTNLTKSISFYFDNKFGQNKAFIYIFFTLNTGALSTQIVLLLVQRDTKMSDLNKNILI